jgi:putative SOS response-associated peptidase YedK
MCNLYSLTRSQDAIRQLTKAMRDTTGNMPPLPGIFPDTLAPVVRTARDSDRVRPDGGSPCAALAPPASGIVTRRAETRLARDDDRHGRLSDSGRERA